MNIAMTPTPVSANRPYVKERTPVATCLCFYVCYVCYVSTALLRTIVRRLINQGEGPRYINTKVNIYKKIKTFPGGIFWQLG
jgi:hypothetical protein